MPKEKGKLECNDNTKREKNSVIFNLITKEKRIHTEYVYRWQCANFPFRFFCFVVGVGVSSCVRIKWRRYENVSNFQQKKKYFVGMHYTMLMQWFRFEMKIILVRKRDGGREIELNDKIAHQKNELCKKQQTFFVLGFQTHQTWKLFSFQSLIGWAEMYTSFVAPLFLPVPFPRAFLFACSVCATKHQSTQIIISQWNDDE